MVLYACDVRPTGFGYKRSKHEEARLTTAVVSPRSTARSNRIVFLFFLQRQLGDTGHPRAQIELVVRIRGGQPHVARQLKTMRKSQRVSVVRRRLDERRGNRNVFPQTDHQMSGALFYTLCLWEPTRNVRWLYHKYRNPARTTPYISLQSGASRLCRFWASKHPLTCRARKCGIPEPRRTPKGRADPDNS